MYEKLYFYLVLIKWYNNRKIMMTMTTVTIHMDFFVGRVFSGFWVGFEKDLRRFGGLRGSGGSGFRAFGGFGGFAWGLIGLGAA